MHTPQAALEEYRICFQAFHTSSELADFLLDNRWAKIHALQPGVCRVVVVVGGTLTVKPHHITTLACLLEEYRLAGVVIGFESGNDVVYNYLQGIHFFARWTQPVATPTIFTAPSDPTSFALWKAEPEGMNAYVTAAYRHFKDHFFQDKSFDFLTIYLGEMFNNVFDHAFATSAEERVAFSMLQYYPARQRLFIAVSDFGMGIPKTVNQFLQRQGQEPVSATEAIRKALELRFTSQSRPHNQGRGLDTLRTGIRELKGTLTIQTARVIYHVSQDGTEFFNSQSAVDFPGTTLLVRMFYDDLATEEADALEDDTALF